MLMYNLIRIVNFFGFMFQEKFACLALAFKTDKLTLEKRIDLHERARDIAEQNVNKEIEGLKEAMKVGIFITLGFLLHPFSSGYLVCCRKMRFFVFMLKNRCKNIRNIFFALYFWIVFS